MSPCEEAKVRLSSMTQSIRSCAYNMEGSMRSTLFKLTPIYLCLVIGSRIMGCTPRGHISSLRGLYQTHSQCIPLTRSIILRRCLGLYYERVYIACILYRDGYRITGRSGAAKDYHLTTTIAVPPPKCIFCKRTMIIT